MRNTSRIALLLSLSAALAGSAGSAWADDPPSSAPPGNTAAAPAADKGKAGDGKDKESEADRAAKNAKRKQRLEEGAKRLRERAAELRKKAASGEAPTPADGKMGRRSPEEQAQRLEEQARKMEERAQKVGTAEDRPDRTERDPKAARERRHKIRRASLNRRWGNLLAKPEVIAEFKLHAERTAKLKRIKSLCEERSKDDPGAKRAAALLRKEEDRHMKRLKEFQAQSQGNDSAEAASDEEAAK